MADNDITWGEEIEAFDVFEFMDEAEKAALSGPKNEESLPKPTHAPYREGVVLYRIELADSNSTFIANGVGYRPRGFTLH